jgi:hypothetical protein
MNASLRQLVFSVVGVTCGLISPPCGWAQENTAQHNTAPDKSAPDKSAPDDAAIAAELQAARKRATDETFVLRYRLTKGEQIRWTAKHLSTTETTMKSKSESTKARTISTKVWEVQDVDADGNMTLVHRVADVDMWQQIANGPEVTYNSRTDTDPPPQYRKVAESVGKPLSTVRIAPSGKVLHRDGAPAQASFGLGEIAVPLPEGPVRIGQSWNTPGEITAHRQDGTRKRIKTRVLYTLRSVKTGVATIEVKTEVLTPVSDPWIQSQLMQQVTDGTVRFDADAGRVLSREMNWDKTVVGFNGHDSLMKYLARFTEELWPAAETAQQAGAAAR